MPFTVVGSDEYECQELTRTVAAGVVQIDNPDHCNFIELRKLLIRSHTLSLIYGTNDAFYENYRLYRLKTM